MSEFKVGDRVRIREDLSECEEYSGTFVVRPMLDCRGQIATIEAQNDDRYLIDLDNHHWDWTKEMFEPIKNQDQQKIEELEQRIEKLEKCVMGEQNSLEKCANVSNFELTEKKIAPLKRWKEEGYKWIFEDTDGAIHIFKSRPIPYNIEELLKGECGNEKND